jgi:hypothetical protein
VDRAWEELSLNERTELIQPRTQDELQDEEHMRLRLRCKALELDITGAPVTLINRIRKHYEMPLQRTPDQSTTDEVEMLRQQLQELTDKVSQQDRVTYQEATDEQGAPVGSLELSDAVLQMLPTTAAGATLPHHDRLKILRQYPAPANYNLYGARFETFELEKLNKDERQQEKTLRDLQTRAADAMRPLVALLDGYMDPEQPAEAQEVSEEARHALDAFKLVSHMAALAQRYRKELYLNKIHPSMRQLTKPQAEEQMVTETDMERMEKLRKQNMTIKAMQGGERRQFVPRQGKGKGRGQPFRPRGGKGSFGKGKGKGAWRQTPPATAPKEE